MIEIDIDTVNQHCVIKSDKMLSEIYVSKEESGYSFFKVKFEKGSVPRVNYLADTLAFFTKRQKKL